MCGDGGRRRILLIRSPPEETAMHTDPTARFTMLESMLRIRTCERGLPQAAPGLEAAAVGLAAALAADDVLVCSAGAPRHLLARGADAARVLGRAGQPGALHRVAQGCGVVLAAPPAGALALAPGVALGRRSVARGITAVVFGDGGASRGLFEESLAAALTWQLPLLYVCENEGWQTRLPQRPTFESRLVDGNDVDAVHAAASALVGGLRADGRPRLLELQTARQRGHAGDADSAHVDAEAIFEASRRDPIAAHTQRLLAAGVTSAGELAYLVQRIEADAAAARAAARRTPAPRAVSADVAA
jgi:acetoin:2,6-dichlorophenolindophenol oxidoreductase subunit alpha